MGQLLSTRQGQRGARHAGSSSRHTSSVQAEGVLRLHATTVSFVAGYSSGWREVIASAAEPANICFYDLDREGAVGGSLPTVSGHTKGVTQAVFSRNGQVLVGETLRPEAGTLPPMSLQTSGWPGPVASSVSHNTNLSAGERFSRP